MVGPDANMEARAWWKVGTDSLHMAADKHQSAFVSTFRAFPPPIYFHPNIDHNKASYIVLG